MVPQKKKILLTRKIHSFALDELKKKYLIKIHTGKIPMPKKLLLESIKDKDGLICFPYDIIDKKVIDSAPNLKTISTYSVGYDHIDIPYAKKKKISIGYTPEVLTDATADLAFALIIDLIRRVSEGDRIIRQGNWRQIYGAYDYVGEDLGGKTLGIFGLGRIGKELAKRARVFGINIIYNNRRRLPNKEEAKIHAKYVSFDSLLSKSDILSIHVPYTKETHEIFDVSVFKKMKKNSVIINTARGKIIKEKDLIMVLKKKIIAGAGLDVFQKEPIEKDNALIKMQNVVLAPHIGSSTKETREKMALLTIRNLNLGISGKKPVYSV